MLGVDEINKQIACADNLRDKLGDQKTAIKTLENLLVHDQVSTENDQYYEIILRLSALYRDSINYEKAKKLLLQTAPLAEKNKKNIYLADIHRSLAFIYLQQRELNKAKSHTKIAIKYSKSQRGENAEKIKANIYAVAGNIDFS